MVLVAVEMRWATAATGSVPVLPVSHWYEPPASAAPSSGATQNSYTCCKAVPPTMSAGPSERAGFTDVLVTGMLTR